MNQLDIALRTVSDAQRTGQIGTPVAARIVAHVTADHGLLERLTANLVDAVAQWFGSEPQGQAAMGGAQAGEISTLNWFPRGQTALVSAGTCGVAAPTLHMVVWGNRGTLVWDADPARHQADVSHASLPAQRTLSPTKPPYGVLLVAGDHTHQPNYAAALVADKRCKLIALADEANLPPRRKSLNEQMARGLGIPLLDDLDSAIRRDDVQIVSVCVEPERRGRIIVQAAAAGKHLYLDKPLAGTLKDANQIVAATNTAGVVSHMMSLVRSDVAQRLRQVVQSGSLGDLTSLHFDLCFAKGLAGTATLGMRRQENPSPQEYELADSKRELSNIGVYPLVTLLWSLGAKVRRVCATTGNYFFQEHQANDMEDFGQMLLELEGGTVVTVSAGRTGWYSHALGGLNRAVLAGTKRVAVVDAHLPRATVWADAPPWTAPPRDPEDPMAMWGGPKQEIYIPKPKQTWILPPASIEATDVSYFLDCVEQGRPSDVSAALAANVTEILLAGYRSAATGEVVSLPLPRV